MKALTFNQYRIINMAMLTVAFGLMESLICKGAYVWFPELPYTLSLAVVFIALEMMRWGAFAAVSALVSGLVFCIASGASADQFLIYCIGNLLSLVALLLLRFVGYERVRKSAGLTIMYVVLVYLLLELGRWGVSIILGNDLRLLVHFLTTDSLSGVFAVVVVLISRQADGLFENQRSYIRRLEADRKAKERENN